MNLNSLKSFAKEARKELIRTISFKMRFILSEESSAKREYPQAVKELEKKISLLGEDQVIEEIAYTWFNRFTALQFMDLNEFNPVKVLINVEGKKRPEILGNAISGIFDENYIPKNTQFKINALLNGETLSKDPEKEVYRLLIVSFCNSLHSSMPFLFERIDDFTELLLPDDLLSKTSIISKLQSAMTKENCKNVEVIGWLYQFYISDKKDEVFENLRKNIKISPENIPAATQLFTPHWIVKYLVENSLGRLWMSNNPNSNLINQMKYYIPSKENDNDLLRIKTPEEIKICDPACGSGHMLTYSFDLLYSIYEEEGYDTDSIPKLILENNLYGIEIDKRAGELSAFALIMKARSKQKKFFKDTIQPNICVLEKIEFEENELNEYVKELDVFLLKDEILRTLNQFKQSDNFGSLIDPLTKDFDGFKNSIDREIISTNIFINSTHKKLLKVINQVDYLREKYHVIVANPPYMGGKGMNERLSIFAKENYPDSKSDLFAMFMERSLSLVYKFGYCALVTMQSWMFLTSYEKLRKKLLLNSSIISLAHMENMVMGIAFGTSGTILTKYANFDKLGAYCHIEYSDLENNSPKKFPPLNTRNNSRNTKDNLFWVTSKDFQKIPGSPIGYWITNEMRNIFSYGKCMKDYATPRQGLATGKNDKFLRFWYEVSSHKSNLNFIDKNDAMYATIKWFPCNKGGEFRRWYGNNLYIVNWENDGYEIKNFRDSNGKLRSRPQNENYYFKEGITWSTMSSSSLSMRYSAPGFLFETKGSVCFPNEGNSWEIALALMNTKIVKYLLLILSPTLDFHEGPIGKVPVIESNNEELKKIAQECTNIAKSDWDSYEISWDFKYHQLLNKEYYSTSIENTFNNLRKHWFDITKKMSFLEEKSNNIFIKSYKLEEDLNPEVPLNEITLTCNPSYRYGQKYPKIQQEEKLCTSTIKEFISYSVGCMFGRYSLEEPGLILAKQGDTLKDYLIRVPNPSFTPDHDNVIPVLNLDWFEDDITGRFSKFLRITFGEENFEENMRFIENSIGKTIRNYFINDFYKDHVQTYKKRPIYWMFSSPKGAFNALIYLHRYHRDNISILLEKYLQEFLLKLRAEKNTLERIEINDNSSKSEKISSIKEIQKIDSILQELQSWEKDIIFPLASQRIEIDLDDGVKENYLKFGNALKKIAGVN